MINDIWGDRSDASPAGGVGVVAGTNTNGEVVVRNSSITACAYSALLNGGVRSGGGNWFVANKRDFAQTWGEQPPAAPRWDYMLAPNPEDAPVKLWRYGRTGTLYGEPGWNELTNERLLPFPNEDVIRDNMGAWDGPNKGARGFCAPGQTLSDYIAAPLRRGI